MLEQFEFFTASFILANLISELIKYLGVKVFKKVDSLINSPLDVEEREY